MRENAEYAYVENKRRGICSITLIILFLLQKNHGT